MAQILLTVVTWDMNLALLSEINDSLSIFNEKVQQIRCKSSVHTQLTTDFTPSSSSSSLGAKRSRESDNRLDVADNVTFHAPDYPIQLSKDSPATMFYPPSLPISSLYGHEDSRERDETSFEYRCEICHTSYKHYPSLCRHRRQGLCERAFLESVASKKSSGLALSATEESLLLKVLSLNNDTKRGGGRNRPKKYGMHNLSDTLIDTSHISPPAINHGQAPANQEISPERSSDPKNSLQYLLKLLIHTSECAGCSSVNCRRMKERLAHVDKCDDRKHCEMCRETLVVLALHAKKCEHTNCNVFLCSRVKATIEQRGIARKAGTRKSLVQQYEGPSIQHGSDGREQSQQEVEQNCQDQSPLPNREYMSACQSIDKMGMTRANDLMNTIKKVQGIFRLPTYYGGKKYKNKAYQSIKQDKYKNAKGGYHDSSEDLCLEIPASAIISVTDDYDGISYSAEPSIVSPSKTTTKEYGAEGANIKATAENLAPMEASDDNTSTGIEFREDEKGNRSVNTSFMMNNQQLPSLRVVSGIDSSQDVHSSLKHDGTLNAGNERDFVSPKRKYQKQDKDNNKKANTTDENFAPTHILFTFNPSPLSELRNEESNGF